MIWCSYSHKHTHITNNYFCAFSFPECYGCNVGKGCSAPNVCTNSCGYILSPNFPLPYEFNLKCSWNITVSRNAYIKLQFLDFDIFEEDVDKCHQDLVEVDTMSMIIMLHINSIPLKLSTCLFKNQSDSIKTSYNSLINRKRSPMPLSVSLLLWFLLEVNSFYSLWKVFNCYPSVYSKEHLLWRTESNILSPHEFCPNTKGEGRMRGKVMFDSVSPNRCFLISSTTINPKLSMNSIL